MYQHYHHSAATNTFCLFCKKQYNSLKDEIILNELEELGEKKASPTKVKSIKNKYIGSLTYSIFTKPDSFASLVKRLDTINTFDYELATLTDREQLFSPASEYAKRITHRAIFDHKASSIIHRKIKDSILNSVHLIKKGSVKGIDPEGNEKTYKLINDIAYFESYDYDDAVKTISIDSNKLIESVNKSFFIKEMIELANKSPIRELLSLKEYT